jgi:hypothetical protein
MDAPFAVAVAVLLGCTAGAAKIARLIRHRPISCGAGGFDGVYYFRHRTRFARIAPLGRVVLTGGGTRFGEHRISRFVSASDHSYFGYDLLFDSDESRAGYRLAFERLSLRPGQFLPARSGIGVTRSEQLPLEQFPPSQTLRLGRALEFRLATADGRHEVIERIEFSKPRGGGIRKLLRSFCGMLLRASRM